MFVYDIIIVEDDIVFTKKLKSSLERIFFKTNYSFRFHCFESFDDALIEVIENESLSAKIYFLDIVLDYKSGLDVANYIRFKTNDWNSFIIFHTSYFKKYEEDIYKGKYGFLRFLEKGTSNYELYLKDAIDYITSCSQKSQTLMLKKQDTLWRFDTNDILYIEYLERKSIVHTTYTAVAFNKTLREIKNNLNSNFLYSHKSCLVNCSNILKIEKNERTIYFKNKDKTNIVSSKYLKQIIAYLEHENSSLKQDINKV